MRTELSELGDTIMVFDERDILKALKNQFSMYQLRRRFINGTDAVQVRTSVLDTWISPTEIAIRLTIEG